MVETRAGATYQVEPDFAARQSITWAIAWLVGAATLALALSVLLVFPDLTGGYSFLSYGRLHAVTDTALWFGWLGTAAFAATYAILPRITEVQLHNEVLGSATTLTWSLLLTGGIVSLLVGIDQGRPLAELPAGVDAGLALMLVFVLYNAGATVARRRERTLYPSGWYLLAAAICAPVVFVFGNLPLFKGVTDVIVSGFYQNGLMMLWFLPAALAVAHYVVPVETGNALYSSAVARAGFWSLVFAGGWGGERLFLRGPGPAYLDSIAIAMTFVLLVPVASAIVNLVATGRGRWHLLTQAFGLRFAVAGIGWLVVWIWLVTGSAITAVSSSFGLTSWHVAERYVGGFGVFSSFAFALIYHVYPLMVGRTWYSRTITAFHFWATHAAVVLGSIALIGTSAVQAGTLAATTPGKVSDAAQAGIGVERLFQLDGVIAAAIFLAAQLAFAYNAYRTTRSGPLVRVLEASATVGSSV